MIAVAIAILWLVGMTNAFNLLDNMDGLAATLAAIAFAFFAIDAAQLHSSDPCSRSRSPAPRLPRLPPVQPAAAAASALVFMGDSGSQTLGFALAALGLTASWNVAGTTVATLILPILVLAVPILDTTLVTIVRLLDGRPISQGGRDHTSHRLVRFGLSEKHAVALLALIATALGATSLAYNVLDDFRFTVVGVLHHVRAAGPVRELPRRRRPPRPNRAGLPACGGVRRPLAPPGRGGRRLRDHHAARSSRPTSSRSAGRAPSTSAASSPSRSADPARRALPDLHPVRPLPLVWRYRRPRDAVAIAGAIVVSEPSSPRLHGRDADMLRLPAPFFIVDALLCTVARRRLARSASG